ncbi:MAG: transcription factor S [Candidatus Ranarchaeia archaeon]
MVFCDKCGTLLTYRKKKLWCRVCNKFVKTKTPDTTQKSRKETQPDVVVDRGDSDIRTNPIAKVECPKCGNYNAETWSLQTRSADEPTTIFFRCTKCTHTWREY